MKNEMIERTWSKKEYQHTIGRATTGVRALLTLKNRLEDYTKERQEGLINLAINDVIRVIWKLTASKKKYKEFRKDYLEALEEKMKNESES